MLPSLLLAGSAFLVLSRPSASARLTSVVPLPAGPPRPKAAWQPAVFAFAAIAAWWVIGGIAGPAVGAVLLWGGPRLLARLDAGDPEEADLAATLPLALDLLAACLSGGAALRQAVDAVERAVPGACGRRLARVSASLAVGCQASEAFRCLGEDRGPAGTAARALARAAEGGAPVAAAVARVAGEARRTAAADAERRAKRAGVLAVGPLGACFLPAFVLIGVVPAVVGLAGPLMARL
jgi:pilus assembly protein TadC